MNWAVSPQRDGLIKTILYNRGYRTEAQIEKFYNPQWEDPFKIPDMTYAIERLLKAGQDNEKVLLFIDFDVDGLSSGIMMEQVLDWYGLTYFTYVPERAENHGLNAYVCRRFIRQKGVSLVVTTDCGTGNADEVKKIQDWGADVIVTDHHSSYDHLAPCLNVNPNRHDSDYGGGNVLSGAGVVFKLAQAIDAHEGHGSILQDKIIDLATLGTVADVMPLREENRLLVQSGLPRITETERVGLKALLKAASVKGAVDTQAISFYLAPRLNSANRMASPLLSYDLLRTTDPTVAAEICTKLNSLNVERQSIVSDAVDRLLPQLKSNPPVAFIVGDWVSGINGLIASKVSEKFNIPAFVGTMNGEYVTASARGVDGNKIDELLEQANEIYPDLFTGFGGHDRAGGFGMKRKNLTIFWSLLQKLAKPSEPPIVHIDAAVDLPAVTVEVARAIQQLGPFGAGFPEPLLASKVTISGIIPLRGTKHNKLLFAAPYGGPEDALLFFNAPDFRSGDTIEIAYNVQIDKYKGEEKPKLMVRSWRKL